MHATPPGPGHDLAVSPQGMPFPPRSPPPLPAALGINTRSFLSKVPQAFRPRFWALQLGREKPWRPKPARSPVAVCVRHGAGAGAADLILMSPGRTNVDSPGHLGNLFARNLEPGLTLELLSSAEALSLRGYTDVGRLFRCQGMFPEGCAGSGSGSRPARHSHAGPQAQGRCPVPSLRGAQSVSNAEGQRRGGRTRWPQAAQGSSSWRGVGLT